MIKWHKGSGVLCLCMFAGGLVGETVHLLHTPNFTGEVVFNGYSTTLAMPPHYEQPFVSGPPAELIRTIGATSSMGGTLYQVMR